MAILYIYDENGNQIPVPAIEGKSAYQYAKESGFTGTEEEFAESLIRNIPTKTSDLTNDSGFITAEDIPEGGGAAIIDVAELPTEGIVEEAFYRVPSFSVYKSSNDVTQYNTVYLVNGLPEVGLPVTTDRQNYVYYYNLLDKGLYAYVPEFLAGQYGYPAGWYPASLAFELTGVTFGGIVYSEKEILDDDVTRFLLSYDIYSYKDVWKKQDSVGLEGTGSFSEVHNYSGNIASGAFSFAGGYKTIASGDYQHVQGIYNIEDIEDRYIHIVGNGSGIPGATNERSNAHTLDMGGNAWFAGDVYLGGKSQDNAPLKVTEAIANASDKVAEIEDYILDIDYDALLAFDTSEIVIDKSSSLSTTSVLGQAILGQMVLA